MHMSTKRGLPPGLLALLLVLLAVVSACVGRDSATIALDPQTSVRLVPPWSASGVKYGNGQELVATERGAGTDEASHAILGRTLITIEPRTDHADAVKRLSDIARSREAKIRFLEVAGWPAVELRFRETLPQRGQEGEEPVGEATDIERAILAVAADDKLINFDISLSPGAPVSLIESALKIAQDARFAKRGNPDEVKQTLERLQREVPSPTPARPVSQNPNAPEGPAVAGATPQAGSQASAAQANLQAGAVAVQNGVGELEVATSANANSIVVASNAALSFSTNRGVTFAGGATGIFGLNDPSVARAVSGNFYLDVIAFPTGTAAQLNVTGCTNAVSRSTNNGSTFALQGYSAQCPQTGTGICFPDQEHMAADPFTASGGNDQLYAVWRNFTPSGTVANCGGIGTGFVTSSITCSQNNGTAWTARVAIPGAGDFPRVAVGRDGSVFVTTVNGNNVLLNRFTSCANGLTAATGFPVTVATMNGAVSCPVAGLDRCNNGNTLSSPTVAPDPSDANHVFVSFSENNGTGGERIITRESTDRGATFPTTRTISAATSTRRFMPWACSLRRAAWTAWYDRRASAAAGATNDLTDYFVGSTLGDELNLSGNADPQCASGWPCAPRSTNDSESCSVQPQLAGRCSVAGAQCDFSQGCPAGQGACNGGGGCPKYGDYNGIACGGNFVVAAWSSATSPPGVSGGAGIRIFASTLYVARDGAAIWRHTGTPCTGDSCPGWQRLDNNPKTASIVAAENRLYQLHNDGWIWQSTGAPCDGDSCPGWQRLDNNSKTIAIAAAGSQLYQLHNDGWIWRYTGTPCNGNSCPGWQRLDNNSKTISIVASASDLYQLHNDGWIWRYTGTPCNGNSCPGWQRLDNNSKTIEIVASRGELYQLHNDGWIWRYTGTPCSGNSCPGWQRLDNNSKTTDLFAADGAALYQLHNDGWIWRYTGTPCSGNSCPGWQRLDNNPRTGMITAGNQLFQLHVDPVYQMHNDGWIWRYTGQECDGDFCPGWQRLDNNGHTRTIAAAGDQLFQLHDTGRIWRYTGTPCSGNSCPGWQMLDNNPKSVAIAAGGNQLFQLHNDGWIWRYTGTPCSGNSCPGWQRLDNNRKTVAIAAGGNQLFQLHNDGWIWRYTGTPCNGNSCPSWQRLDNNPQTKSIAASATQLFQLHNNGRIWRYTGTPCNGNSCPSWQMLDNNPKTVAIAAGGNQLFQLHNDGWIWRYTGTPCNGNSCPSWQRLDNNPKTVEIFADGNHLYQRHNDGWIWRFTGPPCNGNSCPGWKRLDNNGKTKVIVAGGFR
jgi:hypothetical protein